MTSRILVDFGTATYPSAGGAPAWNDALSGTLGVPLALVDSAGTSTGIALLFESTGVPEGANEAGVVTPTPASAMAQLGWPASALRDTFYGSSNRPEMAFVLSNLDPTASYDFTIVASRMNVSDARTTRYVATGFNALAVELDPSNNADDVASLLGVVPDGSGEIRFVMSPAASNTNPSKYFYINALGIDENPGGAGGALLAFTSPVLSISRAQGTGTFSAPLGTLTFSGATPPITLSALDDGTGSPPLWLSLPASSTAGSMFNVTVDASAVPIGIFSATLTASSVGYPDASAQVSFKVGDPTALNLLYYGNSYSQGNGTVPTLVQYIAESAGLASPNTVARLVGGQNLAFHLNDPTQAAAITQALPVGEEWDFVVLQGFSTEATIQLGNPTQFRANALQILTNVRAHSPDAQACLFQTWARGPGNSYYTGASPAFSGPLQMHSEIEESYTLAAADMNAAFGPDTARRAAAGEATFLSAFDPALYTADLSHPEPEMTVMASLAIFTEIYGVLGCDIEVNFQGSSNLVQRLTGFGIDEATWRRLAGIADRVANAPTRHFAGSGEDYLLTTGSAGMLDACARKRVQALDTLGLRLVSPNGLANGWASMLYMDFDTTTPTWPGSPMFQEVHFRSPTSLLFLQTGSLSGEGQAGEWLVPPAMVGRSFLIQGRVLWPSPRTGNPFTTSDAHEIRVLGAPRHGQGGRPREGPRRRVCGARGPEEGSVSCVGAPGRAA